MEEIYRDSVGKAVALGVTGAIIQSVKFYRNGEQVGSGTNISPAQIPYAITHMDGAFSAVWTYVVSGDEYTRTNHYEVITPMFTKTSLVGYNSNFSELSDAQVVHLERLVRKVIEAHTGQSFGYEEGTVYGYGSGTDFLRMPRRVIRIDSLGSGFWNDPYSDMLGPRFRPYGDGFSIGGVNTTLGDGDTFVSNGPIIDPYTRLPFKKFDKGTKYAVKGAFGWESIPADIKDAAMLLAELFSCNEATWRDRYIKAIRAADWRFDFDGRAFEGTGSVSVDRLLEKYTVNRFAII